MSSKRRSKRASTGEKNVYDIEESKSGRMEIPARAIAMASGKPALHIYTNTILQPEALDKVMGKYRLYTDLRDNVVPQLRGLDITSNIVPHTLSEDGIYFNNYHEDYIETIYGDNVFEGDYLYFVVRLTKSGKQVNKRDIMVYHSLDQAKREIASSMLEKHFGNNFKWSGNPDDAMIIRLP